METATTTTYTHCDFSNKVFNGAPEVWNFSKADCVATSTTLYPVIEETSSTAPLVYNGYTYGEIMVSLFLFLIFMVGIFSLLWFGIIKPHVHKVHQKP